MAPTVSRAATMGAGLREGGGPSPLPTGGGPCGAKAKPDSRASPRTLGFISSRKPLAPGSRASSLHTVCSCSMIVPSRLTITPTTRTERTWPLCWNGPFSAVMVRGLIVRMRPSRDFEEAGEVALEAVRARLGGPGLDLVGLEAHLQRLDLELQRRVAEHQGKVQLEPD